MRPLIQGLSVSSRVTLFTAVRVNNNEKNSIFNIIKSKSLEMVDLKILYVPVSWIDVMKSCIESLNNAGRWMNQYRTRIFSDLGFLTTT